MCSKHSLLTYVNRDSQHIETSEKISKVQSILIDNDIVSTPT